MSRATARVAAMQMIYENCAGGQGGEDTLQMVYEELREEQTRRIRKDDPTLEDREWIDRVLTGVTGSLSFLDDKISAASRNWAIDRIARVDLTILRLAVWEIYNEDDVPGSVVINEAVELANCYSGEGSGRFINGILGTILREKEAGA
ncbi:MAG: transcription antitermination factor NusB [Clostridia bacterium]|nr:transcription antitermination factor NusB [Clostridia bacterium]MBR4459013.1 transcription antitermination factor NusB [Clostridia bacterium]